MKIVVFGDVHNRYEKFAKYIREVSDMNIELGIQVGDMGYEPKLTNMDELNEMRESSRSSNFPLHWIDGNHDNHSILQYLDDFQSNSQNIFGNDLIYQPRGSFLEEDNCIFFFIGGAKSTDKTERIIKGWEWYPEEEILKRQEDIVFNSIEYINNSNKPVVVITHSCPNFDKRDEFLSTTKRESSWQQKFLREVLESLNTNPVHWFHGHFHKPIDYKIDGFDTEFHSLGALFGKNNDDSLPFYKIIEI